MQVEGRSLYGRLVKFLRVLCRNMNEVTEMAMIEWFPPPTYPDGDPLLVKVDMIDNPGSYDFLLLEEIDPTPVMYEICGDTHMFMMRLRGIDIFPTV